MKIITDAEKVERLADERVHREYEVNDYQNNVDRFTAILAGIPDEELPSNLQKYANAKPDQIPESVSLADVLLVDKYRYRKSIVMRIRMESIEMAKTQQILDAVDAELPKDGTEVAIIEAAIARRKAQLSK